MLQGADLEESYCYNNAVTKLQVPAPGIHGERVSSRGHMSKVEATNILNVLFIYISYNIFIYFNNDYIYNIFIYYIIMGNCSPPTFSYFPIEK